MLSKLYPRNALVIWAWRSDGRRLPDMWRPPNFAMGNSNRFPANTQSFINIAPSSDVLSTEKSTFEISCALPGALFSFDQCVAPPVNHECIPWMHSEGALMEAIRFKNHRIARAVPLGQQKQVRGVIHTNKKHVKFKAISLFLAVHFPKKTG